MKKQLFILSAAAVLCCGAVNAEDTPLLRVGFMSDTHVNEKPQSAFLVGEACKLFRGQKVDVIVNCGDIADHYS